MKRGSRYLLLALIAVTVIILDQATKYWITQSMRLHESIPLIPNLFSFTYIRNPGAAFGLLAGSSNAFRTVFFGVTSLFALALLGTILVRLPERDWIGQVSIAGILGGAIGNLIDRLRFGEVIDFLDVYVILPLAGVQRGRLGDQRRGRLPDYSLRVRTERRAASCA